MDDSSVEDRFRRQVTCGICSEIMIKPTMVESCRHTFCHKCIVEHLEQCKRGKGTCPVCGIKKKYERDIDRPSLRKLTPDTTLEEVIQIILPEEAEQSDADEWFTENRLKPPVSHISHLTSEQRSMRCSKRANKNHLSIRLNGAEKTKLESPYMLVLPNSTIEEAKKAISSELCGDESMFEKISFLVDEKVLEDDLTMLAIFVHYFKYQGTPMPIDLKIAP